MRLRRVMLCSPRLAALSLFSFAVASILFALADWSASNPADLSPFPFPKPGSSVSASGYASDPGEYALWVDVASGNETPDVNKATNLKCVIDANLIANSQPIHIPRQMYLHPAASGLRIMYSTETFEMPKSNYSIDVFNRGCANDRFDDGMMFLQYYHPVSLPYSLLLLPLAYFFMGLGSLTLMSIFIRNALRGPRVPV